MPVPSSPPPPDETTIETESMFRPPVNRTMRQLDRAFFTKRIPICAARVSNNKHLASLRTEFERSKDLLDTQSRIRLRTVQADPDVNRAAKGGKCLLLREGIRVDDPSSWSEVLRERVRQEEVGVIPFTLVLDYEHWSYQEILSSILPEDRLDEIPTGFNLAGHVAHLNLRDEYLPYKDLIATVLLDKNPAAKTVINKIDDVGSDSVFRTFNLEILAGEPDLNVEVKHEDCFFRFDYSKVYWNSRLNTEHRRLVDQFKQGEAVCDIMAGVGPFAIPAGKKHVFVWANDLNPDSYVSLVDAIKRNKVKSFVYPFNTDGRAFIRDAVKDLRTRTGREVEIITPPKRIQRSSSERIHPPVSESKIFTVPPTFSHFIMNLPASAISFLDAFIGLYHGQERLFEPHTTTKLPMIHVYCFFTASSEALDDESSVFEEKEQICREISKVIEYDIRPNDTKEVVKDIWHVRDVAPRKRMYCVSFRLPGQVAFREPKSS